MAKRRRKKAKAETETKLAQFPENEWLWVAIVLVGEIG